MQSGTTRIGTLPTLPLPVIQPHVILLMKENIGISRDKLHEKEMYLQIYEAEAQKIPHVMDERREAMTLTLQADGVQ